MTENAFNNESRSPVPGSDEDVFKILHPFPLALAGAVGATVRRDDVVTVREYEILARVAADLDGLSARPGLMTTLALKAVLEGPGYPEALKILRKAARGVAEEDRKAALQAIAGLVEVQPHDREEIAKDWASALGVPQSLVLSKREPSQSSVSWLLDSLSKLWNAKGSQLERARDFARTFDDEELARISEEVTNSTSPDSAKRLEDELSAAFNRVLQRSLAVLKSQEELDREVEMAEKFLAMTNLLVDQIRLRLESTKDRLDLQCQMFEADLNNFFVGGALDAIEIEMRDLMQGRKNWTSNDLWEAFSKGSAANELRARFSPIESRYQRLFEQWHHELRLFSREGGMLRKVMLQSVDPRVFSGLLSTQHTLAVVKSAIDRGAEATIGATTFGLAVGGLLIFTGKAAVVGAVLASPAGAAVGIAVAAAAASAAMWKVWSDPEASKQSLAKGKRESVKGRLHRLLADHVFNHGEKAQEVMQSFVSVAYDEYAPLVIDARMAALRAKLEVKVARRILDDTRGTFTTRTM